MGEEHKDIKTKECSLSIDNWIAVLSSEINRNQDILSQFMSLFLVFTSIVIAVSIYYIKIEAVEGLVILIAIFIIFSVSVYSFLGPILKKIKKLEEIRDYTISTKCQDTNEICEKWKQYRKLEKERNLK